MKKQAILFIFCFITFFAHGEKWIGTNSSTPVPAEISLISSDIESSLVHIGISGYLMNEVETPRGAAYSISVEEGTFLLEEGAPNLVKLTTSLIIPDRANMALEIVSSKYIDYSGIEVAPSKGNFTRDIDPASVPFTYSEVYEMDAFYPGELASLRDPYIVRDHRGQTLLINPFQYNPVTKTLRVYSDITLRVYKNSNHGINPLIRQSSEESVSKDFNTLYKRHFLNANQTRYVPVEEEGNMLIICYGDFMDAMEPFIEWKTLSGRPVEMVDVAEIGNSSAIKTYVADYYNTHGLTYLLLVGDAAQVPSSYASGDSDNDYSYIVGNDHYPDIFVGRFSAEIEDHLVTQIDRTLEYEKEPSLVSDWLERSVGIASNQGPGDDNEYDYQHIRNMQTDLLDFTYTYNGELFDGSQGGNDASGNPNPSLVTTEVEAGCGVMLYTGHGSTTAWSTSGFSNSDVNQLENENMYPFIWSVACVNGNFVNSTCFAEAWLRATNNGNPTGAVATLMSTINQSWDPPMEGQDEMVDILVESYANNIKRTFGGISMNGCMQMNDAYGNGGNEMTDTWNCFGDPSVMVRTEQPSTISANYPGIIPLNSTQLSVSANCQEGLVALTKNGQILSTAYLENGNAILNFDPIANNQPLSIVITSFNFIPHFGTITVSSEPVNAILPYPANNYNSAYPFTLLHWAKGPGGVPDYYKVYFGTNASADNIINGEQVNDTTFILEQELDFEATYFWRIASYNQYGDAEGDVWTFNTSGEPDEYFATGDFNGQPWYFGGDSDWTIDPFTARCGQNSAQSGLIDEGQSTSLLIEKESISAFYIPITFWIKTSTVENQNRLVFLIDGEEVGEWSGETDWTLASFNIAMGFHTYEWKYEKTVAPEEDSDCVWVDYINFPFAHLPIQVNAGADDLVCQGDNYTLFGEAINYSEILWTSAGDGTFDDPSYLSPVYFPGENDKTNGGAELTITAYNEVNDYQSDEMFLSIVAQPEVFAGVDEILCDDNHYETSLASASECESILWTTSGNGTFLDETSILTSYIPGDEDKQNGGVILTLTGYGFAPCGEVFSSFNLTISQIPDSPVTPEGPDFVDVLNTPSSDYTTLGSTDAVIYVWELSPDAAGTISGESTTGHVEWNIEYVGEAEIRVRGVNECGEGAFSDGFIVNIFNTVGISNPKMSDVNVKISPNPNNGEFSLQIASKSEEIVNIRIMDVIGNMVYEEAGVMVNYGFAKTFDLTRLRQGLYLVIIEGTESTAVKKFVIR